MVQEGPDMKENSGAMSTIEKERRPRKLLAIMGPGSAGSGLREYARELGARINCEVVEYQGADDGGLLPAVENLCDELKRVEVILTDSGEIKEALSEITRIPIYRIIDEQPKTGGYVMKSHSEPIDRKPLAKTIALGALTAAMYAAVFWRSDIVTQFFTKGGLYAALPIATVFLFSFAHGAFASNLWSFLGIQPKMTTEVHKTVSPSVKQTKTKVKRPRVHAYVNPFHNIDMKTK
jgi:hypothetical protein